MAYVFWNSAEDYDIVCRKCYLQFQFLDKKNNDSIQIVEAVKQQAHKKRLEREKKRLKCEILSCERTLKPNTRRTTY